MRRYNFTTFYGSYGHMIVHNNDKTSLEIIWNGYIPQKPYRKTYKTFRGAKIALGKMADIYTLTECK